MNTATVVGPWTGTGTLADPYRPMLAIDYPGIALWSDITGQPSANLIPSPASYTVQITVDDATLAAIQGDSAYVVLSAEPIVMVTP